jgi:thiol-disulfide isomerase/thioredoxin
MSDDAEKPGSAPGATPDVVRNPGKAPPDWKSGAWLLLIPVIVVGALLLIVVISDGKKPGLSKIGGIGPGEPAPAIEALGWINGEPPSPADRAGRIVVVDAWASWCVPCRRLAPELVRIHEKYAPRGVVFIGLTNEEKSALPEIERFLKAEGITWPNGYGAWKTMEEGFRSNAVPAIWVISADGKVVWNIDAEDSPQDAIERELARMADKSR